MEEIIFNWDFIRKNIFLGNEEILAHIGKIESEPKDFIDEICREAEELLYDRDWCNDMGIRYPDYTGADENSVKLYIYLAMKSENRIRKPKFQNYKIKVPDFEDFSTGVLDY